MRLTLTQVNALGDHFAAYVQQELGLVEGDRIVLQMPNLLRYPIALFGAQKAGLIAVNANPLYTPVRTCQGDLRRPTARHRGDGELRRQGRRELAGGLDSWPSRVRSRVYSRSTPDMTVSTVNTMPDGSCEPFNTPGRCRSPSTPRRAWRVRCHGRVVCVRGRRG
ncbi:AMP-binding protein [Streptomyces sp. NPDC101165]|uniref:AMP-binding protein n=1 Tax=Streptomyces sp. NPDC101165 TaxID=3366119 RepID=UPI0037F67A52